MPSPLRRRLQEVLGPDAKLYSDSQLSIIKACPRKAYFRYYRGLIPSYEAETPSLPATFGSCIHSAMDTIWTAISQGEKDDFQISSHACATFDEQWEGEGMTEMETDLHNSGIAREIIFSYVPTRRGFIEKHELLKVEWPFAVPLSPTDPNLWYIGLIDKVIRNRGTGQVWGVDHKTKGQGGLSQKDASGFRPLVQSEFTPNSQMDGYHYAMKQEWGTPVRGIYVDLIGVSKKHWPLALIPIERAEAHIEAWLWETHLWLSLYEQHQELCAKNGTGHRYLPAFPKNTKSCTDFARKCEYHQVCVGLTNPETMPNSRMGILGYQEETPNA